MPIFVTLCQPNQPLPIIEPINSIDVLDLRISQREGEVALADIVVPQDAVIGPSDWVVISCDERGALEPLFYGCTVGLPLELDQYTKKIQFLAMPQDASAQHEALIETLKQQGLVDEAFIDPAHHHNPSEYLEATSQLFCYDRVTHRVTLSDVFEGRETFLFKDQILSGGLSLKLKDSPLSGVRLRLSCEWVQEAAGELNLMPFIERRFSQSMINTLTPQTLLQTWPQRGTLLGRSGYGVVRADLQVINPLKTGILGHYPTVTPIFGSQGDEEGWRYPRYWLRGEFVVCWQYRQKRREVLTLELQHRNQVLTSQAKMPRVIKIHLNNIESRLDDQSSSRFFDTSAGRSTIDHALKMSRCHLAYSARAGEILVQVPFTEAMDIHLDGSAEVIHSCLPGGKLRGKVVSYVMERSAKKAVATIKIALATGVGEGAFDQGVEINAVPVEGLKNPDALSPAEFICGIDVTNAAEDQIRYLHENDDSAWIPPEMMTQLGIHLIDLRSHDVLERKLSANPLTWSAPQQVNL